MQIRCDQTARKSMGQESRDDAHLFILQALSSKPKRQWQSGTGTGSEAGRDRGGEQGRRRGKQPPGGSRAIKSLVSEASLAPPRIKTSVRGLVKQQQDNATGKPPLNFAMKQDKMHLNGPIFHSSPIHACNYSQGYPVCALGCLAASLPCTAVRPMFAFC